MLFPWQFFIYNYTKVLVSQSSFNTITVYICYKGFSACMFVCDQQIFCFEIFSERSFAVSQSITFLISWLTEFVIFADCCRFELKLYHQQKVYFS